MGSRELRRGRHVVIHKVDGKSVAGKVVRVSRRWVTLVEHRIEVDGTMHALKSEELLVPRDRVDIVEVTRA